VNAASVAVAATRTVRNIGSTHCCPIVRNICAANALFGLSSVKHLHEGLVAFAQICCARITRESSPLLVAVAATVGVRGL